MKHSLALIALVFAVLPLGAAGQWAWTDKDGRKVFSDRAPTAEVPQHNIFKRPDQPTTRTAVPSTVSPAAADAAEKLAASPTASPSAPKAPGVDKELAERKKKAELAQAAERKAEEERFSKARADNCSRARQAQKTLSSGIRIGRINSQGENEVLDDSARAAEAKRIQGVVESDCK